MVDVLEKLKSIMSGAAERGRTGKTRHAQRRMQAAGDKLTELLAKYGDVDKEHDNKLEELTVVREQDAQFHEYIEGEEDVSALIAQAEKEINDVWRKRGHEITEARDEVKAAREDLDTAVAYMESHEGLPDMPHVLINNLLDEISGGDTELPGWTKEQLHAMIRAWAGQAKKLQDIVGLHDHEKQKVRVAFAKLNSITKQYNPGYIEALSLDFKANWDEYIEQARTDYLAASMEVERTKSAAMLAERKEFEELRIKAQNQEAAMEYYAELEELLVPDTQTAEDLFQIKNIVGKLLTELKVDATDPQLLELVEPVKDIFDEGSEFRRLRKQFSRSKGATTNEDLCTQFPKACSALKGARCVIIGGTPREVRRLKLEKLFGMESLEWAECEKRQSIRQTERIANGVKSYDYIMTITTLCGHHVDDIIKAACKNEACKFVRLSTGYGATKIAQAVEEVA